MPGRFLVLLGFLLAGGAAASGHAATALPLHTISIEREGRVFRLWLVLFDAEKLMLRVIDNAAGRNAPRFFDLGLAMQAEGCVAGCNGGFFNRTPFDPVGLMISDGKSTGRFDPKSWMKGMLVVRADGPALELTDAFQPDQPGVTALIQSGPWLVRGGESETDNNNKHQAARTFVGHNGKGTWFIGVSDACTLHELAAALRADPVRALVEVQAALNLDGGPSTGLWLKGVPYDFYRREVWTVRNYIGLAPKNAPKPVGSGVGAGAKGA